MEYVGNLCLALHNAITCVPNCLSISRNILLVTLVHVLSVTTNTYNKSKYMHEYVCETIRIMKLLNYCQVGFINLSK